MDQQILKQVRNECSKFVDINNILNKMVEKQYIQKISSIMENIFREEQAFAIQELGRLMKQLPKNKTMDLNHQFKMNTSIFKSNFDLILKQVVDNLWLRVQSEFIGNNNGNNSSNSVNQQQNSQGQNQQAQQNQNQDNQRIYNQEQQGGVQLNRRETGNNLIDISQNDQFDSTVNQSNNNINDQLMRESGQFARTRSQENLSKERKNLQNDSWVRKTLQQQDKVSSSKSLNTSYDIYGGKYNSQLLKNKNVSFSMLSKKDQGASQLEKSQRSINSVMSHSKLGGPVPLSEISDIKGSPNSFSRAARELNKSQVMETSPGPSHYNVDRSVVITRKSSPSTKFDKSIRKSWLDEKLRYDTSCQSPGPEYNPTKSGTSKPTRKTVQQSQQFNNKTGQQKKN